MSSSAGYVGVQINAMGTRLTSLAALRQCVAPSRRTWGSLLDASGVACRVTWRGVGDGSASCFWLGNC